MFEYVWETFPSRSKLKYFGPLLKQRQTPYTQARNLELELAHFLPTFGPEIFQKIFPTVCRVICQSFLCTLVRISFFNLGHRLVQ